MLKAISIKNFRGIEEVADLELNRFNIFIGDNGTSKTSTLEAIHYTLSPNFLSGRIKHTDFLNGNDDPIEILAEFDSNISVGLPDGYTEQMVECNKVFLGINKREKKAAGKVFSNPVTLEHNVVPIIARGASGYSVPRKNGSSFTFTERLLSLSSVSSTELPRSFYYGKDRDRQLQKGYNSSLSTIIEDQNWRFSRALRKEFDETGKVADVLTKITNLTDDVTQKSELKKHEVFKEFNKRTKAFGLEEVGFSILDSQAPFENAFFSSKKDILDLPIKNLGSGIEMIISILFLETLASMSKEKLLILIDEPELHLHPRLQSQLAEYLLEISSSERGHQVFVTTHSPVFFRNCMRRDGVTTFITKKEKATGDISIEEVSFENGLFPWSPSWGEVNYFAYQYLSTEFHNELYGFVQETNSCFSEKDVDDFLESKLMIPKNKVWTPEKGGVPQPSRDVTLPVFIRNKIHHPENKAMMSASFTSEELKDSIEQLISAAKLKP